MGFPGGDGNFPDAEFPGYDGKFGGGGGISSSTSSTVDPKENVAMQDVLQDSDAMQDSDDAAEEPSRFESSKRLIEKRRNRRSAGDELERQTARCPPPWHRCRRGGWGAGGQ